MDWMPYEPEEQQVCQIQVFDDGVENVYNNLWKILATNNRGKYRIENIKNNEINFSISCWKVRIIDCHQILEEMKKNVHKGG